MTGWKRFFIAAAILLLSVSPSLGQQQPVYIFPSLQSNNTWTGTNTFNGPSNFPGGISGAIAPTTPGGTTLGTAALPYSSVFVGNAATNNIQITGTATAARLFTLPDANSNPVQPSTAPANQFATGISSAGVVAYTQPSAANLSNGLTGSGLVVLQTSPTLITPNIGAATGTTLLLQGNALVLQGSSIGQLNYDATGGQFSVVAQSPGGNTNIAFYTSAGTGGVPRWNIASSGGLNGGPWPVTWNATGGLSAPDTGISRCGVAILCVGNGAQGDLSGTMKGATFMGGIGSLSAVSLGIGAINSGWFKNANGHPQLSLGGVAGGMLDSSLWLGASGAINFQNTADPNAGATVAMLSQLGGAVSVDTTVRGNAAGSLNLTNLTNFALGTATSGSNFGSGSLILNGSWWNGTAAVAENWTITESPASTVPNPANSFFNVNHSAGIPNAIVQIQDLNPATSGANFNAPVISLVGHFWNGTASAPDATQLKVIFGAGANPTKTWTLLNPVGGTSGAFTVDYTAASIFKAVTVNATTGYQVNGAATANQALIGNGTNFVSTALSLTSAQFANQGTTTTVLHGNALGNPSFASVAPADTTGVTGSGTTFVLSASPSLVTPNIGAATGISLALGGGTALSTTNQTGTGNIVLATSPSVSNLTDIGTSQVKRVKANQGTALVNGDFSLSPGWGNTASFTVSGTDAAFSITITANGTGLSNNPTVTLTFHDGTWTNPPVIVTQVGQQAGGIAAFIPSSISATAVTYTWLGGTAVAGLTYNFQSIATGK